MTCRLVAIAALMAAIEWGSPRAATADDRPVVFLHGFGAEARDWAAAADRLARSVAIEPHLPNLSWRRPYQEQAGDLQSRPEYSGLPGNTVVVGHSNGGVVAREWSRRRPLDGIVTLGTPHRGAPLIAHFSNWVHFNSGAQLLLNDVVRAFSRWTSWVGIYPYAQAILGWVSDFSIWSTVNLAVLIGLDAGIPVASQMDPRSPYLADLNSGANLGREAVSVPGRVGVVTIAHNYYWAGPVRAIAPEWGDANATAIYGAAAALLFWGNYIILEAQGADPAALDQGLSLITVANHLLSIDPMYCRLVSSLAADECKPNDGIVPFDSQMFPGAPNLLLGEHNDGPAHKQQKDMGHEALYDALVRYVHLTPRSVTPPPGPDDPGPSPPVSDDPHHPAEDGRPDVIVPGQVLYPDDVVDSDDGRFHLLYQTDGNLVLYDEDWEPRWSSGTVGTSAGVVVMQHDGNLVIYDAAGDPVWDSGDSLGHPGAWLIVQNDGNVVIYDVDGTPLWATNTNW